MVSFFFLKGELKMKNAIVNCALSVRGFVSKHSSEILIGVGVVGMGISTVSAVKATPKAMALLEEAEEEKGDKLTWTEKVKAAWKPYIPSIGIGLSSAACIIGASAIQTKRNAALAAAYALSEKTLTTYRDKVIDRIGSDKEKEIRHSIAQDDVANNPVIKSDIIITDKGNTLCKESISGRVFKSDIDTIKKVVNELNRDMFSQNYVSLNELYSAIGLEQTNIGDKLGWNIADGLIDIEYSGCLTADDEPCIYIDYNIMPRYGFDR